MKKQDKIKHAIKTEIKILYRIIAFRHNISLGKAIKIVDKILKGMYAK